MEIAYFNTHFPYRDQKAGQGPQSYFGGAESVAYNLALYMARRGHRVRVFAASADSRDATEEYDGLRVYHCGTSFRVEKGSFSIGLFRKPFQGRADIVHAHVSTPPGDLAGTVYASRTGAPLAVTYHGDGEESYGRPLRRAATYIYNRVLLPMVLARAAVIICPSRHYIEQSRFLGPYREKVVAIPNGVNLEEVRAGRSREECKGLLGLPPVCRLVLFVGVLLPYKGPDVLVRAMARVAQRAPDARLVLAGEGPMRRELERLVRELGLEAQVSLPGFIGNESKPLYYGAADLFALPSTMGPENFPVALLEAMAAGLPAAVSDLPTLQTLVQDGRNGLVSLRGDPESLASTLLRLLEDGRLRAELGEASRRAAEGLTWEAVAEQTERAYEGLLGARRGNDAA